MKKMVSLEGTGSLILDRENKIVYANLSARTDLRLLDKWCFNRLPKGLFPGARQAGCRYLPYQCSDVTWP